MISFLQSIIFSCLSFALKVVSVFPSMKLSISVLFHCYCSVPVDTLTPFSVAGEVSCEIECDGKVHIQGSTAGGKIIKKRSREFHMKTQNLCPSGPFTVSFNLPGPVDPRLFSPNFRDDGIFEAVIVKHKEK